jgi:hypothetical protein
MITVILEVFRRWGAVEADSSSFFASPLATPSRVYADKWWGKFSRKKEDLSCGILTFIMSA